MSKLLMTKVNRSMRIYHVCGLIMDGGICVNVAYMLIIDKFGLEKQKQASSFVSDG